MGGELAGHGCVGVVWKQDELVGLLPESWLSRGWEVGRPADHGSVGQTGGEFSGPLAG